MCNSREVRVSEIEIRRTESSWDTYDGRRLTATRKVIAPARPRTRPAEFKKLLPISPRATDKSAWILALGDMQTGKMDGGNVGIRNASAVLRTAMGVYEQAPAGHMAIVWTGDHVEGAVSQGGALAARTVQSLTEQIRSIRSLMRESLLMLREAGVPRVTMAAVPGNHGEAARSGRGPTWTYSDSHDTDALAAVREGALMADDDWLRSVEWSIPGVTDGDRDGMIAKLKVAKLPVIAHHGHMWRPGKGHDWWRGQAYHYREYWDARMLICGHLHHFEAHREGDRYLVQAPACEGDSAWWRLRTGSIGSPGGVMIRVEDGCVVSINPVDA